MIREIATNINDKVQPLVKHILAQDKLIDELRIQVANLEDVIRDLQNTLSDIPWNNEDYPDK